MINVAVTIDYSNWNDFRIVRLVNQAGKYPCSMNIVSGDKYINLKSISAMMDYFSSSHPGKDEDICIDGDCEEEATEWLVDYIKD